MKAYIGTLEDIKENVLSNQYLLEVGEIKQLTDYINYDDDFIVYYQSTVEDINFQKDVQEIKR